MKSFLSNFSRNEDGAVSADWVALTAAGMLLAVAIGAILNDSAVDAGNQIGTDVAAMATP